MSRKIILIKHELLLFFFNDTATTELYTLSLTTLFRSAAPRRCLVGLAADRNRPAAPEDRARLAARSEEHTSELQSHVNLVCRLLLEKKKNFNNNQPFLEYKKIYN